MMRTYSELITIPTFEERFAYLRLNGYVGVETFGFDRVFNQRFYRSVEWRNVRDHVIVRDKALDLGVVGYPTFDNVIIHHMNPIALDDILHNPDLILNPEYLITTSSATHNGIHYGDEQFIRMPVERKPGDTKLW